MLTATTGRLPPAAIFSGALLTCWLGLCSPAAAQTTAGLWVRQTSLASFSSIERLAEEAANAGFTTLLVEVPDLPVTAERAPTARSSRDRRGRARGTTRRGPPGADRVQQLLTAAHRRGLRVHAWLDVTRAADAGPLPTSRLHVARRHPEWLMVPRELAPRLARLDARDPAYLATLERWVEQPREGVDGLHLSPILPEVSEHVSELLSRLLSRYAFDGVHLDSAQFPSSDFDYSRAAIAAFRDEVTVALPGTRRRNLDNRAAVDPLAYPDAFPSQWSRFRRSKMTALVARLGSTIRRSRPGARVSVSVVADHDEALGRRLQDWRAWAENGFVQILCLRPGRETLEDFNLHLREAQQFASGVDVWVGVDTHRLLPGDTFERIRSARRLGIDGIIMWTYDAATDRARMPPDHLQHLGLAITAVPPP